MELGSVIFTEPEQHLDIVRGRGRTRVETYSFERLLFGLVNVTNKVGKTSLPSEGIMEMVFFRPVY